MKNVFAKFVSLAVLLAAGFAFVACDNVEKGSMTDSRDGKTYKTVKIGDQVWMAENLNYQTGDSKCYENKPENCEKYGRLYTWNDALTACPDGWHLPSKEEFEKLLTLAGQKAGSEQRDGLVLKSYHSWKRVSSVKSFQPSKSGGGTDDFGFRALAAGENSGNDGKNDLFMSMGWDASFWSSTEDGSHLVLNFSSNDAFVCNVFSKEFGLSVRCVKD